MVLWISHMSQLTLDSSIHLKGKYSNLDNSMSLEQLAIVWLSSAYPNLDELMLSEVKLSQVTTALAKSNETK
jgi:hypothetical protein